MMMSWSYVRLLLQLETVTSVMLCRWSLYAKLEFIVFLLPVCFMLTESCPIGQMFGLYISSWHFHTSAARFNHLYMNSFWSLPCAGVWNLYCVGGDVKLCSIQSILENKWDITMYVKWLILGGKLLQMKSRFYYWATIPGLCRRIRQTAPL